MQSQVSNAVHKPWIFFVAPFTNYVNRVGHQREGRPFVATMVLLLYMVIISMDFISLLINSVLKRIPMCCRRGFVSFCGCR